MGFFICVCVLLFSFVIDPLRPELIPASGYYKKHLLSCQNPSLFHPSSSKKKSEHVSTPTFRLFLSTLRSKTLFYYSQLPLPLSQFYTMSPAKVVSNSPSTLEAFPHVHDDPATLPRSLDPFTVTTSTGFLPYLTSPTTLPAVFKPLMSLLARLPVVKEDGTPGLLATYELGPAVLEELPDLTDEVDKLVTADGALDLYTIMAVFRDYSFLASSYLLEPCWKNWGTDPENGYGLGREVLPKAVARPLYRCGQM